MQPEVENPKDRAASNRLDLSLFPDTAVAYGALGMTEGHLKYGGFNWREAGVAASVYIAAARRHISKWYNGEEVDPKTNIPHLASALACLAILIDAQECDMLKDDRPPTVRLTAMYDRFEQDVKELKELIPAGPGRYTAA